MNVFVLFVVSAFAAVVTWRVGRRGIAFGLAVFALFPALTLLRQLPWWVYLLVAVLVAVGVWHHLSRSAAGRDRGVAVGAGRGRTCPRRSHPLARPLCPARRRRGVWAGRAVIARRILFLLLGVVAAAAAVLSFAALRDLALTCGFTPSLAWLLPVVVDADAGAAAGSLVWLGGRVAEPARRFDRVLALALLGLSVAANALGHGLEAFRLPPAWWVVVAVAAIAPVVLGAVVHLAVLVGRIEPSIDDEEPFDYELTVEALGADALDEHGLSRLWDDAPPATEAGRAAALIAAGAGRRRLSRELDITEYEARQLLVATRATRPDIAAGRAADPIDPPPAELRPAASLLNGVLS